MTMLLYSASQGLHGQCNLPCPYSQRQPTCQCACICLPGGPPVLSTARRRHRQKQWVENCRKNTACRSRRAAAVLALAERVEDGSVSVVLLAGGVGKRMGAAMPKQYLPLQGQPIALYSLDVFAAMREVGELVVVCDPSYDSLFREHHARLPAQRPPLVFARPGAERQDSVSNGFEAIRPGATLVAIHDSARPLVQADDVRKCMADALQVGAAVLGVRVKPTIKEVKADGLVVRTLERASLWEVQTPQVIRPELLRAGFELVRREHLEVTDDVSIIEALGSPVRLTAGSYSNLKVTTPDDLVMAEGLLKESRGAPAVALAAAA